MAKKSTKVAKSTKTVARKAVKTSNRREIESNRGRKSEYSGKKLFPSKATAKTNPRRAMAKDRNGKLRPANGWKAIEFIRKHPGATYESFVSAGLRPADLRWDVEAGNVIVR